MPLANFLKQQETDYCGTIESSRKHVPEMKKDEDMKIGDLDWRIDPSGVSITKWMDNKAVQFVSNIRDPSLQENTTRKNKDRSTITVVCNQVNKDYNKHMCYVEEADMLKSLYGLDRKSKKWWHRIAFHFLDVTVVNALVLFKCIHEVTVPLKKIQVELHTWSLERHPCRQARSKKSSEMAAGGMANSKRHKTTISLAIQLDGSDHLPAMTGKWRRCNLCSTKKQPHRTK